MQHVLTKKYQTRSVLIRKGTALGIAEFVQVRLTRKLNHRWWPTHENECLTAGGREVGFNHVCSDEARTVLPIWNKGIKLLIWIFVQSEAFLNCVCCTRKVMPPSLQAKIGLKLSLSSNLMVPFDREDKHVDNKDLIDKGLYSLSDT